MFALKNIRSDTTTILDKDKKDTTVFSFQDPGAAWMYGLREKSQVRKRKKEDRGAGNDAAKC